MGEHKGEQTSAEATRSELKIVEAELDRHRELLLAARQEARKHGLELASLERLVENQQASARQLAKTLRHDADTIDRQANTMADQVEALADMTSERDESATRAASLQAAVSRRILQVREKEELLALVLNVSVDGVLVYRAVQDESGALVDFECVLHNPAAKRIYGVGSLAGKRMLDLHPDVRIKGLWSRYVQVLETGEPFEGEYCYAINDQLRWFRVLAVKLADGIAIMFSDISQRKELEEQIVVQMEALQQADQMKNQFLGVISHEIRTPINAIMGFSSILEDELSGSLNETQRRYVAKILKGSDVLLALVDNLLDMSRIQAGKLSVETHPCAFSLIVTDVLANLETLVGHCALVDEVSSDLPPVLADEKRVAQVLTNLIVNAIKFMPDPGTITVRASVRDGFLRCEVADTGVGITEENLSRLFHVFVQLDMTATRSAGGAGLGLTICKSLIEAQGGSMGVESQVGEGSIFWFTLPLATN